MMQPSTDNILAVMCAPALICSMAGVVRSINEGAAQRLRTTLATAKGRLVSSYLSMSEDMLSALLLRTHSGGHASGREYVYTANDHSRHHAMQWHAQRLKGSQFSDCLLLVLTDVEPGVLSEVGISSESGTREPLRSPCAVGRTPKSGLYRSDMSGANALSNVALGLVHEVNQPLTAVAAYAHSCRRWLSATPAVHPKLLPTVDKIIEQVHVTGQMVNSLKGLVRGSDEERQLHDLNELVNECLELLALDQRLDACAVEWSSGSESCPVLVCSAQIKIVLLNLLRNGLDASLASDTAEPCLRVSVNVDEGNWVSVTIEDSGAGISAEAGEQLFQPFETSKSNGLGLGLVISRCLATVHGGQIEYEPGVPDGTSFRLSLPLTRALLQ